MSSLQRQSSHESLEGVNLRSLASTPNQLETSLNMNARIEYPSPSNEAVPSSNPLRRSLVLRLDQARREKGETLETGASEAENVTEEVFLPCETDLISALDLDDSSHHRRPKLRLRPSNSLDMDELYCQSCGGSITDPFQTPRERRSVIPPRHQTPSNVTQGLAAVRYCQCHATTTTATIHNGDVPWGPRLSFVHMASPARNQQLVVATDSLQLWLDDDDSDDADDNEGSHQTQNGHSAFRRRRVMLQPKALQRCHSDPAYITTDQLQPLPQQEEPTSSQSMPANHPPGLLNASSGSSTVTSPGDQAHALLLCQQGSTAFPNSGVVVDHRNRNANTTTSTLMPRTASIPSQQEQQESDSTGNSDDDNEQGTSVVVPMPLLPTMATPETVRPRFRAIALAPNPKSSNSTTEAILLQDLPCCPE